MMESTEPLFSSLELTEESASSAVQIGDPITQKKMLDMLLKQEIWV